MPIPKTSHARKNVLSSRHYGYLFTSNLVEKDPTSVTNRDQLEERDWKVPTISNYITLRIVSYCLSLCNFHQQYDLLNAARFGPNSIPLLDVRDLGTCLIPPE